MDETAAKREALEGSAQLQQNGPLAGLMSFNIEYGYVEALMRGLRSGFLKRFEYRQLCQCDTLDDVKLTLGDTDYGQAVQSLNNISVDNLMARCEAKYIQEFQYIRTQAVGPLNSFLDFIMHEYLIQSISFIITSLIKGSDPETLLEKCHPLGKSPHLRSILTFDNFEGGDGLVELYRTVLVDTPVAKYFAKYFNSEVKGDQPSREIQRVYDEIEIDVITNMLEKLWLEDFYDYCRKLGGETWVIMKELLDFEADRRAISITMNSFGTKLNDPYNREAERKALYPSFGSLYPEGTMAKFSKVGDMQQLQAALEPYTVFRRLWQNAVDNGNSFTDEWNDQLYRHEVHLCKLAFGGQSHFAAFYAFTKLKKMELRNLQYILSCISLNRSAKDLARWIPIFN